MSHDQNQHGPLNTKEVLTTNSTEGPLQWILEEHFTETTNSITVNMKPDMAPPTLRLGLRKRLILNLRQINADKTLI